METIKSRIDSLPTFPGCYLMKNKLSEIIYIGKAKNIRNRVTQYFTRPHSGKTQKMVSEIASFDIIITTSEKEALLLELNLVHQHQPKYNILLKDGKQFPYIKVSKDTNPILRIARKVDDRKSKYFGPFPDSSSAYEIMNLLNRLFPLRKCRNIPKKPCLYYHINNCLAPCIHDIKRSDYEIYLKEIEHFLNGDGTAIKNNLTSLMYSASERLEFERANEYKGLLNNVENILSKQKVHLSDNINRDIFAYHQKEGYIAISTMLFRGGLLTSSINKVLPYYSEEEEVFVSYIMQFYEQNTLPKEIFVPNIVDKDILSEALNVKVITPTRGDKFDLLQMVGQNAIRAMEEEFLFTDDLQDDYNVMLEDLASRLGLESLRQIEMIDNSHNSGKEAIGAAVVYIHGVPNKKLYRRYKLQGTELQNDYQSMKEVTYRRYYRMLSENQTLPNLLIVDGGLQQIKAAYESINGLQLPIPVVGLAKDSHHRTRALILPDGSELELDHKSNLFFFLTKIQDEVHRFAIDYHRNLRSKSLISSFLDEIEGLGNKRKESLLKAFGTVKRIKEANIKELQQYVPKNVAQNIIDRALNDDNK